MTVAELIEKLKEFKLESEVKLEIEYNDRHIECSIKDVYSYSSKNKEIIYIES